MKVWKLSPKGQNETSKNGYIRVRAQTEQRAREIARQIFAKSKVKTMHSVVWSTLDWSDESLVECLNESEDISNSEGILDIQ